jgi:hypothetical protein
MLLTNEQRERLNKILERSTYQPVKKTQDDMLNADFPLEYNCATHQAFSKLRRSNPDEAWNEILPDPVSTKAPHPERQITRTRELQIKQKEEIKMITKNNPPTELGESIEVDGNTIAVPKAKLTIGSKPPVFEYGELSKDCDMTPEQLEAWASLLLQAADDKRREEAEAAEWAEDVRLANISFEKELAVLINFYYPNFTEAEEIAKEIANKGHDFSIKKWKERQLNG